MRASKTRMVTTEFGMDGSMEVKKRRSGVEEAKPERAAGSVYINRGALKVKESGGRVQSVRQQ